MNSAGRRSPKKYAPNRPTLLNNNTSEAADNVYTASVIEWDKSLPIPCLSKQTAIITIIILALVCYGQSAFGGVVFDDDEAVANNKDVTGENDLLKIFVHDFWGQNITLKESHKSYRPLTSLTYRLNYFLAGGLHPLSLHIVNIVLHVIISVMSLRVFEVLLGHETLDINQNVVKKCPRLVWLCAVLFCVHPIHSENVASLVGRADLLCAVFFCVSFFSYLHSCSHHDSFQHSSIYIALCVLSCTVAMFCKEQGITVLGICSLYDIICINHLSLSWILQNFHSLNAKSIQYSLDQLRPFLVRHVVLAMAGVMLMSWRYYLMGSHPPEFQPMDNPASFMDSAFFRIINYNYIYSLNMWLLFCPHWLCFDWSMGCIPLIQSVIDIRILAIVIFWTLVISLLIKCAISDTHQNRVLLMAIACLVVPFLPSSNLLFRVGFVIAERNLYLPSFGFCIVVAMGINSLCSVLSDNGKKVISVFIFFLVTSHIAKCISRCEEWREEKVLYETGLRVCPLNAKVWYNIGKASGDTGDREEAIKAYRQALRLHPEYDQALNNLANILKDEHGQEEAEMLLTKAVTVSPTFAAAWMNLGIVQVHLGKFQEAEKSYLTALKHRPHYPDCHYNLGNLYISQRKFEEAKWFWELTIAEKPDHSSAWINIVTMYQETGKYDLGVSIATEALKHLPNEPNLYFGLGNILGKQGKYEEAEKAFIKAIELDNTAFSYHGNLGVLYHRWKRYDDAEKAYNSALSINPGDKGTKDNLLKLRRVREKQSSGGS